MIAQPLDSLCTAAVGVTCVTSRADRLSLNALASLPLRFYCSPTCVQGAEAVLVAPLGSPCMAPDAKNPLNPRWLLLCSHLPSCSLCSLLCVQAAEALVTVLAAHNTPEERHAGPISISACISISVDAVTSTR